MAITEVRLASLGASGNGSGSDPSRVDVTYQANFHALVDDLLDGPKVVLDYFRTHSSTLPWYGKPYKFGNDFDASAVCRKIDPRKVANSYMFAVSVTFEPLNNTSRSGQEPEGIKLDGSSSTNPLDWHDEIDISYTQVAVPVEVATFRGFIPTTTTNPLKVWGDGSVGPVMNTAHDTFDPPPEAEDDLQILRISRNVVAWDDTIAEGYRNSVNVNDVFINKPQYNFAKTIPARHGRIKNISGTFAIENRVPYFKISIEVHIKKSRAVPGGDVGWRIPVVDRGLNRRQRYRDKTDAGHELTNADIAAAEAIGKPLVAPITDIAGNPVMQPVLLNGNGQPLKNTEPPVILIWQYYPEIDWSFIPW